MRQKIGNPTKEGFCLLFPFQVDICCVYLGPFVCYSTFWLWVRVLSYFLHLALHTFRHYLLPSGALLDVARLEDVAVVRR